MISMTTETGKGVHISIRSCLMAIFPGACPGLVMSWWDIMTMYRKLEEQLRNRT